MKASTAQQCSGRYCLTWSGRARCPSVFISPIERERERDGFELRPANLTVGTKHSPLLWCHLGVSNRFTVCWTDKRDIHPVLEGTNLPIFLPIILPNRHVSFVFLWLGASFTHVIYPAIGCTLNISSFIESVAGCVKLLTIKLLNKIDSGDKAWVMSLL